MNSTVAAELLKTENVALDCENETIALLARTRPARKLIVLVFGRTTSAGKTTSSPGPPTFVTVRFAEIAAESAGMPHIPATLKSRVSFGWRANPNPFRFTRVSRTRQGVSVLKESNALSLTLTSWLHRLW